MILGYFPQEERLPSLLSSKGHIAFAKGSFANKFWQFLLGRLLIAALTLLAVLFMIYGLIGVSSNLY